MNLRITDTIPILTVFLQGLLSFFSPCVLPLLPVYISYLSGGTMPAKARNGMTLDRKKVLINTVFFVIGISFSFFVLGLGMRALGRFFSGNRLLFARIGGVIAILFGLYQLGVFGDSALLNRERRLPFQLKKAAVSPLTALFMGFVFSFAWTPCVGPTLSGVLLLSGSAESGAKGFLLIGVYTLGFVIPFLLTGFFTVLLLNAFRKHRNVLRYTVKVSGVLLILTGLLMLTGYMNSITGYLSKISGSAGTEVTQTEHPGPEETSGADVTASETEDPTEMLSETETMTETEALTETEAAASQTPAGSEEETKTEAAEEVFPAPDFRLTDQYGKEHSLSDYRGKIVFLNFWATWCPPCRAEMPAIQEIYEETLADPDPDLVILGVAFPGMVDEKSVEGITAFMQENGYTYPTLMDTQAELMLPYYITAYPTTYMIDTDRNIYGYVPGSMSREIMDQVIRQTREYVALKKGS